MDAKGGVAVRFLFSHPFWFSLARLPFRRRRAAVPQVTAPVVGQAALAHISAGRGSMDRMGCEMIALFNALHFLGQPQPLEEIVRVFERRRWLLLGGRWGATPFAIGTHAAERGIPHRVFRGRREHEDFSRAMRHGPERVFVVSYWLGDTVFSGAHAALLVRRDGVLWGYNLFNGQQAPLQVPDLTCLCYAPRFIVGYAFS